MFGLPLEGEFVEEIQVDVDGLIVEILVVDSGLADPIASLCLQEVAEDISKGLVADDLLYQIVVVFLTL